jgi:hypothetical protein
MESETHRIMPLEAKRLASQARTTDVPWLVSFLLHCRDAADAARSIAALRTNCPEKFKQPPRVQGLRRGVAPTVPPVNRDTRAARGRIRERAAYGR